MTQPYINRLLPPSASRFEQAATQACASLGDIPVPLRQLWNAKTCPPRLLPYLAWTLSVDYWDELWSEAQKRQTVIDAFEVHRYKGTTSSLRRIIEPFGFTMDIAEWWSTDDEPGTFRLIVNLNGQGITEDVRQLILELIDNAKPCSRQLLDLSLISEIKGTIYIASASYSGSVITIYPQTE
ncbi:phage tail protein I [Hafnia alvei]|uniref:phage tail protein I n=1 Tax=Hafnia alvei TaxID=569 RepID=UPI000B6B0F27|nr:phage tail protein I [Hafnia alvei]MBI0277269.1 phage tail protein I [Hafnia alvei]PNK97557.1 phage tail protein I [Hafnia alvei]PNL03591.1 phage tail protein I [Hafnia alvei]